ncbi:MAG: LacI family DNA-binding transcriptional regulator [Clostridia bacterium]|nr:LacI family DNA-binding transcriptional regulator [Clostridia bacterium]
MATIKDVSEYAGVTVTTVSRVLNNRGYIAEKTRKKVYEAMAELNYQPNEIARSLLRKRSNIIGLIIPSVGHPFFAELAEKIELYAYENGFKLLLCNSHLDSLKEREYIDMLRAHKVDGIIMGSHTLKVDDYLSLNMPMVTIDRRLSNTIPYIASDNFMGGKLATQLLIERGCKKLAIICGNLNLDMLSNKRFEAFLVEVVNNNLKHITIQTEIDVFDNDQYDKLVRRMFEQYPDVDGVFVSGDATALHVLKACSEYNKRVPEDIKIVGYDDIRILSLVAPQLTTIRQPIGEMGRLAVELIIKQINQEPVTYENILPVSLVERSTT